MFSALMTLTTPDNTGASCVAFEYARAIVQQGGQVTLAHGPERDSDHTQRASYVAKVQSAGIRTVCEPRLARPMGSDLVRTLARLVEQDQLQCVIGNNQRDRAVAVNVARQAGVPSIVCGHNQHVFRGRWPLPALKRAYYARAMRDADLVVCSSGQVRDEFVQDFGVAGERCLLMPHGIDTHITPISTEQRSELRQSFGVDADQWMLCNVGRIDPQKGQDILLKALQRLPESLNYKLVLVGAVSPDANQSANQRLEAELRDLATSLDGRVIFAGWRDDFDQVLQASDAYVHSARWEGLPLTVLAALAARIPTITPDNSARPPGFEHGKHGLLTAPEDPAALAATIEQLAGSDTDLRRAMAEAGRQLIEADYDMERIGARFVQLVQQTITPTPAANHQWKEAVVS